ncbi:MAG: hypothetical protein NVS3B1_26300 [Marmoricola sp.]
MSEQFPEAAPVEAPVAETVIPVAAPETPVAPEPAPSASVEEEPTVVPASTNAGPAEPDQVALVSYNADGTPCQSEGFVVIAEDEDKKV